VTGSWILGFDTATRATAVALSDDSGVVLEARDDPPPGHRPRHVSLLLPLCGEVLERAGVGFRELERLAVGIGPGTFTGLRIGVATARALAQAAALPVVGVSTLQSLALEARQDNSFADAQAIAAVLDARRGEAFAAVWRTDGLEPPGEPLIAPQALTPASLAARLAALSVPVLAVGEGAVEFRQVLESSGAFVPDDGAEVHRVSAAGHCWIARRQPAADPAEITPQYLRLPDAEIARRAKGKQ
jgi:tRNA threonylcarbamoyladenosine biosynthesis protein TsaB